jgi:hypothetical protein
LTATAATAATAARQQVGILCGRFFLRKNGFCHDDRNFFWIG